MSKLDLLFIRACKSKDPEKRIFSVYNRFYFRSEKKDWHDIVQILFSIADRSNKISARKLIEELNPERSWLYCDNKEKYNYWEHCAKVLISHFRLIEVSRIQGWITPAIFRNQS